ncbi:hypothetical protein BC941DRAFT_423036 [Chlamydoabsidia padenii]|nr:hypothetical protein BC941DRAFT_423036 [Chlamydoabsidia padenii]
MDIEPSYIHPSHSDSPSSGHYADGPVRRDSVHTPSQVKQEPVSPMEQDTTADVSLKQEETQVKKEPCNADDEPSHIKEEEEAQQQQEPTSTPQPTSVTTPLSITTDKDSNSNSNTLTHPGNESDKDGEDTTMAQDDTPSQSTTTTLTFYSPAMYLARRDKRKSSPAVLGLLGLGEAEETKLGKHLSKHRNSIEAAMLLANFNRPQAKSSPEPEKKQPTWKDTLSVDSNPDRKTRSYWEDAVQATRRQRRYSYDGKMSWGKMSREFLEQASLLQELKVKPYKIPSAAPSSTSSVISSPRIRSTTWYSESLDQRQRLQQQHQLPLPHLRYPHPQMPPQQQSHPSEGYPPMYSPANGDQQQQQQMPLPSPGYYHYPYSQSQQPYYFPGKLPLPNNESEGSSNSNSSGSGNNNNNNGTPMHPMYHPHNPHPPMGLHLHPLHPAQQQHAQHYQHLQQSHAMAAGAAIPSVKPKRKRRDQTDDEENLGHVMPGDADFPDMSERDVEAARNDVEARPRRQKLRYLGDLYTPQWVRYNGQSKEGLCDTCKPGKWLQLKNSAFWYHKQFFHGISSVSGKEFLQPMDTRWVDQDIVEGLCHQCHQWVSVSNVKRKNSVLWYRHAHKCHVYHKPKNGSPKRR